MKEHLRIKTEMNRNKTGINQPLPHKQPYIQKYNYIQSETQRNYTYVVLLCGSG